MAKQAVRKSRSKKSTTAEQSTTKETAGDALTKEAIAKGTLAGQPSNASQLHEPSPDQLKKAKQEAEKALKELERQGAGDSTLSRYFREMAGHRVLTPQEEIDAAREVERLEIGYWEALFAKPCVF